MLRSINRHLEQYPDCSVIDVDAADVMLIKIKSCRKWFWGECKKWLVAADEIRVDIAFAQTYVL